MGRPDSPGHDRGGGESIPPIRALRLRLGLIAAALVLGCTLGVYPILEAGDELPYLAALAVLGVVLTILALLLRTRFAGAALCSFAIEYVVSAAAGSLGTLSLVVCPAGLLVLCEVIFWVRQLPAFGRVDSSAVTAWLGRTVSIAVASAVLAVIALAAAGIQIPGYFTGTIIGSAAAVLLLALPWLLARGRVGATREAPGSRPPDRR